MPTRQAESTVEPPKDPDHDHVEQTNRHKPRSCRNQPIQPNRRSQHPWRVLTRYRFRLSHWAATTDNLEPWQQRLAYSLGQRASANTDLTFRQAAQGLRALEEALRLGFEWARPMSQFWPNQAATAARPPGSLASPRSGPSMRTYRRSDRICDTRRRGRDRCRLASKTRRKTSLNCRTSETVFETLGV